MNKNYFYYEKQCSENEIDALIDRVCNIADENHTVFFGGGLGRLCMLSEEYGDYEIPEEILTVVMDIAKNPETGNQLRGFFIDFSRESFDKDKRDYIISEI